MLKSSRHHQEKKIRKKIRKDISLAVLWRCCFCAGFLELAEWHLLGRALQQRQLTGSAWCAGSVAPWPGGGPICVLRLGR